MRYPAFLILIALLLLSISCSSDYVQTLPPSVTEEEADPLFLPYIFISEPVKTMLKEEIEVTDLSNDQRVTVEFENSGVLQFDFRSKSSFEYVKSVGSSMVTESDTQIQRLEIEEILAKQTSEKTIDALEVVGDTVKQSNDGSIDSQNSEGNNVKLITFATNEKGGSEGYSEKLTQDEPRIESITEESSEELITVDEDHVKGKSDVEVAKLTSKNGEQISGESKSTMEKGSSEASDPIRVQNEVSIDELTKEEPEIAKLTKEDVKVETVNRVDDIQEIVSESNIQTGESSVEQKAIEEDISSTQGESKGEYEELQTTEETIGIDSEENIIDTVSEQSTTDLESTTYYDTLTTEGGLSKVERGTKILISTQSNSATMTKLNVEYWEDRNEVIYSIIKHDRNLKHFYEDSNKEYLERLENDEKTEEKKNVVKLIKTGPKEVNVGDQIEYKFSLENIGVMQASDTGSDGGIDIQNIVIIDMLDQGLMYEGEYEGKITSAGATITFSNKDRNDKSQMLEFTTSAEWSKGKIAWMIPGVVRPGEKLEFTFLAVYFIDKGLVSEETDLLSKPVDGEHIVRLFPDKTAVRVIERNKEENWMKVSVRTIDPVKTLVGYIPFDHFDMNMRTDADKEKLFQKVNYALIVDDEISTGRGRSNN